MLRTILSISGKPGLYRLLTQGHNNLIVESLQDGRRSAVMPRERVISLGDITMYTTGDDIHLSEVLDRVYKHQEGKPIDLNTEDLRKTFGEIIENFDRDRVYVSDIKKLFSWYNILVGAGFDSFANQEEAPKN